MKLNKYDREAFIRAVMDDVPEVSYDEQARKLVTTAFVSKLPPKIRASWNDPELRGFVKCDTYFHTPGSLNSLSVPPVDFATPELKAQLHELAAKKDEQRKAREALENKVEAVISTCSTLKQAHEQVPEFAKYLPEDRDATGTANLPAIANVVAELTKAGWPKGKKKGGKS